MNRSINLLKKYYWNLFFIFFLGQFLFGFIFMYPFPIYSVTLGKIWHFFRNLIGMTFFIYSFISLLKIARKNNEVLFTKTKNILILYFFVSLLICSLFSGTPYTLFSYLGELTRNIILHGLYCDSLCITIKFIIWGNF